MEHKRYINLFLVIIVLLFTACKHDHEEDAHNHGAELNHEEDQHNESNTDSEHSEVEELHLSERQAATINLKFGDLNQIKVNNYIKATGALGVPSNAYATISPKAKGLLSTNKKFVEGQFINKGTTIAYIENPDFITNQQQYLELKEKHALKNLELNRQRDLMKANAGVKKNLENAQSEFSILETQLKGMSKQLEYLGIDPRELMSDNISRRIAVRAPSNGYITKIKMQNGMYVQPENGLMEILDDDHIHLEIDVFEKDIANISIKQNISFTLPAISNKIYKGSISTIGKEFNIGSKTVRVHGHIIGEKPKFLKDLFINAKIWLDGELTAALPEKAIIEDDGSSYIYVGKKVEDEYHFLSIMVIPGPTEKGFTAIKLLDSVPADMNIVTNGSFYIYAQSKTGVLKHEH